MPFRDILSVMIAKGHRKLATINVAILLASIFTLVFGIIRNTQLSDNYQPYEPRWTPDWTGDASSPTSSRGTMYRWRDTHSQATGQLIFFLLNAAFPLLTASVRGWYTYITLQNVSKWVSIIVDLMLLAGWIVVFVLQLHFGDFQSWRFTHTYNAGVRVEIDNFAGVEMSFWAFVLALAGGLVVIMLYVNDAPRCTYIPHPTDLFVQTGPESDTGAFRTVHPSLGPPRTVPSFKTRWTVELYEPFARSTAIGSPSSPSRALG